MKQLFLLGLTLLIFLACQQPQQKGTQEVEAKSSKEIVIENIMNRRSIRAYKPEQIKDEELSQLIVCAINAPSARNLQPWEVRVIQKPELLAKIDGKSYHNAPTLIVVAGDTRNGYGAFDCGLLTQNILLAAESMDIGTCVVGNVISQLNRPEAKELMDAMNLPEGYVPLVGISLGYKDQRPEAKPREAVKVQIIK